MKTLSSDDYEFFKTFENWEPLTAISTVCRVKIESAIDYEKIENFNTIYNAMVETYKKHPSELFWRNKFVEPEYAYLCRKYCPDFYEDNTDYDGGILVCFRPQDFISWVKNKIYEGFFRNEESTLRIPVQLAIKPHDDGVNGWRPFWVKEPVKGFFDNTCQVFNFSSGKPNQEALEQSSENQNIKNIDLRIKNLTIQYCTDDEITIQERGKGQIPVNMKQLRFKGGPRITWNNFLNVLQNLPHQWFCPEDRDRQQMKTVSERLIEWMTKHLDIQFPSKYKLFELVKGQDKGTYCFKFKVEYSDTIREDESSIETFVKNFYLKVEDYKKNPDDDKLKSIQKMAGDGMIKKFFTDEEVRDFLKE